MSIAFPRRRPAPRMSWAGVPHTDTEAEALATRIERAVENQTGRRIRNLSVEVSREGVFLRGRCDTFYAKQLAQQAAMALPGGDRLTNDIEVA